MILHVRVANRICYWSDDRAFVFGGKVARSGKALGCISRMLESSIAITLHSKRALLKGLDLTSLKRKRFECWRELKNTKLLGGDVDLWSWRSTRLECWRDLKRIKPLGRDIDLLVLRSRRADSSRDLKTARLPW